MYRYSYIKINIIIVAGKNHTMAIYCVPSCFLVQSPFCGMFSSNQHVVLSENGFKPPRGHENIQTMIVIVYDPLEVPHCQSQRFFVKSR